MDEKLPTDRTEVFEKFLEYLRTDVWPLYEEDCDIEGAFTDALSNASPYRIDDESDYCSWDEAIRRAGNEMPDVQG